MVQCNNSRLRNRGAVSFYVIRVAPCRCWIIQTWWTRH